MAGSQFLKLVEGPAPADARRRTGPGHVVSQRLSAATRGDGKAMFDLGVAFATGSDGLAGDYVEAHKWFNLAAASGHEEAQACRADLADEMTAAQIAEAQRRARDWIRQGRMLAA